MRPIERGDWPKDVNTAAPVDFTHWHDAQPYLEENTGCYCHICEMRVDNAPAVEHIKPKSKFAKLKLNWNNFLQICTYCNSKKRTKIPNVGKTYWPHKHNTFLLFDYSTPEVKLLASGTYLVPKAELLRDLYGIDHLENSKGRPDRRRQKRNEAITKIYDEMPKYLNGLRSAQDVANSAADTGFWSSWYTAFKDHKDVLLALRTHPRFPGTAHCFDNDGHPLPRNPHNSSDPT